jgi:predicted transposase YdaD
MGMYDDTIKTLVGRNPQAIISFVLEGAVYQSDVERELKARTVLADSLYYVRWHDEPIVLHIEFQVGSETEMPRRIWEYNALADIVTGKPVYSVVCYLVPRSTIPEPVYVRHLPDGQQVHVCAFRQIKLWEVPADAFEQPGLENLLPLLPLAKDGQNYTTVERMIRDIQATDKPADLLWIGEAFAGLVLTSEEDQQWIKERFHGMLHEVIKESWVYKAVIQEGKLKGLQEGKREGLQEGKREEKMATIVRVVTLRFPSLLTQAEETLARESTMEQLQATQDKLFLSDTLEEAAAALRAHGKDL